MAHLGLGNALLAKRPWDEAIASYRTAIRLRQDDAAAHLGLGSALEKQGNWRELIAAYEQAIGLMPKMAPFYARLAEVLTVCPAAQYRDSARAVEVASKAVELDAQSAMPWRCLGWAQYRAGNWKASIEALEKSMALEVNPKGGYPGQWFFLAMAYWQLEQKDEARKWYDRATAWMEKHAPKDEYYQRVKAEAAALLKIDDKPKPDSK